MTFKFLQYLKEPVYDNHGCSCSTDYKLEFTIDGIIFDATYRNIPLRITIYHDFEFISEFRNDKKLAIEDFIKELFTNDGTLANVAFHKIKGDTLNNLKEKLVNNLLEKSSWD